MPNGSVRRARGRRDRRNASPSPSVSWRRTFAALLIAATFLQQPPPGRARARRQAADAPDFKPFDRRLHCVALCQCVGDVLIDCGHLSPFFENLPDGLQTAPFSELSLGSRAWPRLSCDRLPTALQTILVDASSPFCAVTDAAGSMNHSPFPCRPALVVYCGGRRVWPKLSPTTTTMPTTSDGPADPSSEASATAATDRTDAASTTEPQIANSTRPHFEVLPTTAEAALNATTTPANGTTTAPTSREPPPPSTAGASVWNWANLAFFVATTVGSSVLSWAVWRALQSWQWRRVLRGFRAHVRTALATRDDAAFEPVDLTDDDDADRAVARPAVLGSPRRIAQYCREPIRRVAQPPPPPPFAARGFTRSPASSTQTRRKCASQPLDGSTALSGAATTGLAVSARSTAADWRDSGLAPTPRAQSPWTRFDGSSGVLADWRDESDLFERRSPSPTTPVGALAATVTAASRRLFDGVRQAFDSAPAVPSSHIAEPQPQAHANANYDAARPLLNDSADSADTGVCYFDATSASFVDRYGAADMPSSVTRTATRLPSTLPWRTTTALVDAGVQPNRAVFPLTPAAFDPNGLLRSGVAARAVVAAAAADPGDEVALEMPSWPEL